MEKKNLFPVSIVGAGPGDPELLTVRAKDRIEQADVLIYDCLPAVRVVDLARKDAEVMFLNKHDPSQTPKPDMVLLMKELYEQGKKVVRLKAGDALMFNGGGVEARRLRELNVPFEMIPGLTAASAGANRFAIPVTEKFESNGMLYVIADTLEHRVGLIRHAAQMLLMYGTTLVLYMAYDHLTEIFALMAEEGIKPDMPVTVASMISLADEDCCTGTIADIQQRMEQREMLSPFIFYVGNTVQHYIEPSSLKEKVAQRIAGYC